ncbi:MAG: type II toxin-antitoxin system mRNA interferase toxin, RelE/StbE family [Selenomonadaceae bacterium]|nr:type II toxin-antitoxin system mRNA interferase toxin, RelE/StbE family [Selenomonadaceae bacterium]
MHFSCFYILQSLFFPFIGIEPDWLLIYEIQGEVLVLILYRLGSHSDLFD